MVYLHDGSFEGMLHASAAAVKSVGRVRGVYAAKDYKPQLFDTQITLAVDRAQALRLFQYLQSLHGDAARLALNGFLSEDPEVGTYLYKMVQACLTSGGRVTQCYTHDAVISLQKLCRKVEWEIHRFEGFIRFRILDNGVQYAPFEPDCNIIGYCALHFKRRLNTTRWILHDIRRNLAVYWDSESLQYIDIEKEFSEHVQTGGEVPEHMLSSTEKQYQQLWQLFHNAIANNDRENLVLQRQHIPRRYWKYLVELPSIKA